MVWNEFCDGLSSDPLPWIGQSLFAWLLREFSVVKGPVSMLFGRMAALFNVPDNACLHNLITAGLFI